MKKKNYPKRNLATWMILAMIFYGLILDLNMVNNINPETLFDSNINKKSYIHSADSGYIKTGPIYIDELVEGQNWSDCSFVTGSGTELNPFVIEGLEIETSSTEYCISIRNSNSSFTIRNCNLTNLNPSINSIIIVYRSTNGLIFQNLISGIGTNSIQGMNGIYILESTNMTLSGNYIKNVHYNIAVINSIGCILDSNTCQGYNNTQSSDTKGIYMQLSKMTQITKNNITGHASGIYLESSMENMVEKNTCTNNTSGIHLQFFGNNTIRSNYASNNSYGISTWNSDNNSIINNTCTQNLHGIYVGTSSDETIVSQNNCTNNSYGILCSGSINNTIINNNASNSLSMGISIDFSYNTTIVNNTMNDSPDGIIISYCDYNFISNNTAVQNNNGIRVYFSKNNLFANNYFSHAYDAIYVNGGGNNTFTQNTMQFCGSGWESANTNNNIVFNNTMRSNYWGIQITGYSYLNMVYENNISLSSASAIYLNNATKTFIENNICSESDTGISLINSFNNSMKTNKLNKMNYGITVTHDSNENLIVSNDIKEILTLGIYINSGRKNNVSKNEIHNAGAGIGLILSDNQILSNNNLTSCDFGIAVSRSNESQILENMIVGNSTNKKGLYVEFSINCIAQRNYLKQYITGISLNKAENNTFIDNYLEGVGGDLITLEESKLNVFWENHKILFSNATVISAGQSIQFNCSVYETGLSFEWNFGDSLTNATVKDPVYTYTKSGLYTVKLTIKSVTNEFSVYSTQIDVKSVTNAPQILNLNYRIGQMNLTWVAPTSNNGSAIIGYNIYRGTSSGNEVLLCVIGNLTSFLDSNLTLGLTYFYRISTRNGIGESALSISMNAKAYCLPPAPMNVSIVAKNDFLNLTWNYAQNACSEPITGFKIYRGNAPNNLSLFKEVGMITNFVDTNITQNTIYYYMIVPVCSLGDGESSIVVSSQIPKDNTLIYVSFGVFGGVVLLAGIFIQRNPELKEKLKNQISKLNKFAKRK